MSSDLKPCPFCGSLGINLTRIGTPTPRYNRFCDDCGAEGPYADGATWQEAVGNAGEAWNRRTEARADSAVPSSHVSGTDESKASSASILREAPALLQELLRHFNKNLTWKYIEDVSLVDVDEALATRIKAWEAARSALAGIPK